MLLQVPSHVNMKHIRGERPGWNWGWNYERWMRGWLSSDEREGYKRGWYEDERTPLLRVSQFSLCLPAVRRPWSTTHHPPSVYSSCSWYLRLPLPAPPALTNQSREGVSHSPPGSLETPTVWRTTWQTGVCCLALLKRGTRPGNLYSVISTQ